MFSRGLLNIFLCFVLFWIGMFFYPVFGSQPLVRNFDRKLYKGGTQNWDIAQSGNDWVCFANNYGLLEFDGDNWTLSPVRNFTTVRAISYDSLSNRIYVGAFNEFGYFMHKSGKLVYTSISKNLRMNDQKFSEIWTVSRSDDEIFFQGDNDIFSFKNNSLKHYHFPEGISCSAVVNNNLIVASYNTGLSIWNRGMRLPILNGELLKYKKVVAILPYGSNGVMFITDFNGIYLYDGEKVQQLKTDIDPFLKQNQVFCAAIKGNQIAIGTVCNGLVVRNMQTEKNVFVNTSTGLQNNTILSVSFDRLNNIWVGLDKGIDYVMINAPTYNLFGDTHQYGSGYASCLFNGYLYLGTNQGLFRVKYLSNESNTSGPIESLAQIKGQVWSLDCIDNTLFCSSDKGVFTIADKKVDRIANAVGSWGLKPLRRQLGNIIGTSYGGFFILTKSQNRWVLKNFVKGFDETGGMFIVDKDDNIWFSHWLKGVYKLKLSEQLDRFVNVEMIDKRNGLPSSKGNTLFNYKNATFVSNVGGVYRYDPNKNRLIHSEALNRLLGYPTYSMKVSLTNAGDLLAISAPHIKYVMIGEKNQTKIDSISFYATTDKLLAGFEHINMIDRSNILVATEDGFSIVNKARLLNPKETFSFSFKSVKLISESDSVADNLFFDPKQESNSVFESDQNSLRFEFIGTEYRSGNSMVYSCNLENYDSKWSAFSESAFKEYHKLSPGRYVLKVRAKNKYNGAVKEIAYKFTISAPWYESFIAIIVYLILLGFLVAALIRYVKLSSEKGAREMEQRKEVEMAAQKNRFEEGAKQKEKEIIALKNQKLQYELRHKSQDLASSTMNLIRKNEILLDMSRNLEKLSLDVSENSDSESIKKRIQKMQDEIEKNIKYDNNWKKFQENFDLVYENYLSRLGSMYPELTVSDKKLCAYLKMNLSSKEIAPLLNMSFRSVEMSRHRLRKKLNLSREANLTEFLQNF